MEEISPFLLPLPSLKLQHMKYVKILFAVALIFTVCSALTLKNDHSKPVYAFGLAASFTDTIVFYTEIQVLDSAKLNKDGFLASRDLYSYQLKNYLEDHRLQQNSTCMIYFSENRKKLEKEAAKVLSKYMKSKNLSLQQIAPDKFQFKKPEE